MEKLKESINAINEIAQTLDNEKIIILSKFLRQRMNQPDSYLVFLGESCSGKSTLINKIIGEDILPVSSVPSTGAITEVYFDKNTVDKDFYAINKNATMEKIKESIFCDLAVKPDADIERLRLVIPAQSESYAGVRLFDTPGYGSLMEEHEEVLMDFLPNCDGVVYTVSYRMGIQEDDYSFLQKLKKLVRREIPINLLINRCPKGTTKSDRRVKEIYQYVSSLLENSLTPLTLIESFKEEEETDLVKQMNVFWNEILKELNSPARKLEIKQAFTIYTFDLIVQIKAEIERRTRNAQMDETQKNLMKKTIQEFAMKFENAENEILRPGFEKIKNQFPRRVEMSAENVCNKVCAQIDNQSGFSKEETGIYINQHILKYNVQQEVEELQFYLSQELDAIDKEVNDYLNKAFVQFEADLKVRNLSETEKAGFDAAKGIAGKLLNSGLLTYFAKFGGAGGAGAGIANAASHVLKKVGDLFGKTFTRETHNALKHVLAKIGLTSTKVLAASGAAIVEAVFMIIDLNTWKPRLCSQVKKTMNDWKEDIVQFVLEDIEKLEQVNINNLTNKAKEILDKYKVEDNDKEDIDMLKEQINKVEFIERNIR